MSSSLRCYIESSASSFLSLHSSSHGVHKELLWSQFIHLPNLDWWRHLPLLLLHTGPHYPAHARLLPRHRPLPILPEIWYHDGAQVHPTLMPLRPPADPLRPSPDPVCGRDGVAGCQRRRAPRLCGAVWLLLRTGLGLGYSPAKGGETQGPGDGPDKRPQRGPAAVLGRGFLCWELGLHLLVQSSLVVGPGEQSTSGEER